MSTDPNTEPKEPTTESATQAEAEAPYYEQVQHSLEAAREAQLQRERDSQ